MSCDLAACFIGAFITFIFKVMRKSRPFKKFAR